MESDFRPAAIETADEIDEGFAKNWGPVANIWEGYAADPEIRYQGSSGGALTAIAAYCLEVLGMHGVLHIAQDPDDPIRNCTQLSRNREQLLGATGSRYSPASMCNGLDLVEAAPTVCALIGKPSEISGLRNACRLRPKLRENVGVTLSFFCAESPSTLGTIDLLKKLGVEPASLDEVRYRGRGWPGNFAAGSKEHSDKKRTMSYQESWAFLQSYRPWSVQLWPDGTGELADISCGDPWYAEVDAGNPGFSLIVARTERGSRIIEGAIDAGYLKLRVAESWKLEKSQSGLLVKKSEIWGRRMAMQLLGLPVTRLRGLDLRHCWSALTFGSRFRAIFGTLRRIIRKKLYRKLRLDSSGAVAVPSPRVEPLESAACGSKHRVASV
jgi:coenzyme F420 hydrogenase subunit beta